MRVDLKVFGAVLLFCLSTFLHSQTAPTNPDGPKQDKKGGFMRIFPASYSKDAPPLSAEEKLKLFATNTVNPFQVVISAAQAGMSQAADTFEEYGQGAEGYGKRFGSFYADKASSEFFGTFLFPSLLRQDPRYFRKETGTSGSRVGYAISRVLVTRSDSGRSAPNTSLWMASLAAGGLSNAYYPENDRGVGLTFSRAGITLGSTAAFNVVKEFWPDIKKKFFRRGK